MSKKKKIVIIILSSLVAVLVAAYLIGAVFFMSHFFPNTAFGEEDVSLESNSQFVESIDRSVEDYALSIEGSQFDVAIAGDQVGLSFDKQQIEKKVADVQNEWAWPIEVFKQHDVADVVEASFDQAAVEAILKPKVEEYNKTANPSVDATIAYDKATDELVVQEEVYGNKIDYDTLLSKADDCIAHLIPEFSVNDDIYVKPAILADDPRFEQVLPAAQAMIGGEISLTLNEGKVSAGKITKDMLVGWLTYDPETLMPSLNQEAITAWGATKGSELNTVGTTRTYTRGDGVNVTISGGSYGWQVNADDLANTIIQKTTAGDFSTIDIPCSQAADVYNGKGARDWGAYVDIDISEQKVRYYNAKDELLKTVDCVTGRPSDGRSTPTGVYYLRDKKSPEVLTGYNSKGEKEYETHVSYWMPFIRNSVGLHDATWQSSFGGSRYLTNGSHGCVNLSLSDAKWFYDNLPVGTAVIVHE